MPNFLAEDEDQSEYLSPLDDEVFSEREAGGGMPRPFKIPRRKAPPAAGVPDAPAPRPIGAGNQPTIRELLNPQPPEGPPLTSENEGVSYVPKSADDELTGGMDAVRKSQERANLIARAKPTQEAPKWWQRLAAGAVGGLAGYTNASGRTKVDPTGAINGIYGVPGFQRKTAEWQNKSDVAEEEAKQAQGNLTNLQRMRKMKSDEDTAQVSREHMQAQTAALPGASLTSAIEHGGEIIPDGQSAPVGREGSVQDIGGKKIFFPSKGQQAKEKKAADQENWQALPKAITDALQMDAGTKVPASEMDSYVRMVEAGRKDNNLHFETHTDDITGDVTTRGYDTKTGDIKFAHTSKGEARKRPQMTTISIPGLNGNQSGPQSQTTGDEFLRSLPPGTAAQIKRIADGAVKMPPVNARGSSALLRDAVFRYDPEFSEQRAQVRQAFTTGPDGRNIGALNTATIHLDQLADVASALGNGSFQPGNEIWNRARAMFGNSAPTNFESLKAAVAGEMANALKGQATDVEIATMGRNLNAANSPQQLAGAVEHNLLVLGGKLNTYHERYSQQIPNDKVWNPVLPSARAVFDKHGIDPTAGPQVNASGNGGGRGGGGAKTATKSDIKAYVDAHPGMTERSATQIFTDKGYVIQ